MPLGDAADDRSPEVRRGRIPYPRKRALDQPLARRLQLTLFPDVKAKSKWEHKVSLRALAAVIGKGNGPAKEALPLLKLGTFGDLRNPSGCLRHNANMLSIDGIELDYDGEQTSMEEAAEIQGSQAVLLYTSPSHKAAASLACPVPSFGKLVERTIHSLTPRPTAISGTSDGGLQQAPTQSSGASPRRSRSTRRRPTISARSTTTPTIK